MNASGQDMRPGFTLIELLVVIVIITLMISLLLPVLGSARDTARQLACLSNMRQLGLATDTYRVDHDGYYPQPARDDDLAGQHGNDAANGAIWFNALDPYLQQQDRGYASAADRNYVRFKQDPVWESLPEAGDVRRDARTIKMNAFLGDINDDLPGNPAKWAFIRDLHVPEPSETVAYIDGRAPDTPSVTTGNVDTTGSQMFSATEIYVGLRHDEGANVTFADGHARHHRDAIRQMSSGYRGWYIGTPETNGYAGSAAGKGPHDLFWRVRR